MATFFERLATFTRGVDRMDFVMNTLDTYILDGYPERADEVLRDVVRRDDVEVELLIGMLTATLDRKGNFKHRPALVEHCRKLVTPEALAGLE